MATGKITVAAVDRSGAAAKQQADFNRSLERAGEVQQRTDNRALESSQAAAASTGEFQVETFSRSLRQNDAANERFLRSRLDDFQRAQQFSNETFLRGQELGLRQAEQTRAVDQDIRQRSLRLNAEVRDQNLKSFAAISETAASIIRDQELAYINKEKGIGLALGASEGMPIEDQETVIQAGKVLGAAAAAEGQANEVLAQTDAIQAEDQRKKSPIRRSWRAYYRAVGATRKMAAEWQVGINTWINSDEKIIPDPLNPGQMISPKELAARGSAETFAAINAGAAFLLENAGLKNVNPAILAEHLYPRSTEVNAQTAERVINENRKQQQEQEREDITLSIGVEAAGIGKDDFYGMTEWINSKTTALRATGLSNREANDVLIPAVLSYAVRVGDPELLAQLERSNVSNEQPGLGSWGDHPRYQAAFRESYDSLEAEDRSNVRMAIEAADSLVPQLKLEHQERLKAAGSDPNKIVEANTWYKTQLGKLSEANSPRAQQELQDFNTRPITASENAFEAVVDTWEKTGEIPSEDRLEQMMLDGQLTNAQADFFRSKRPLNAGNEVIKAQESSIKGLATAEFTRAIIQGAGLDTIQKTGGGGRARVETLTAETMLHLSNWINSQKVVPSASAIQAEALKYIGTALKDPAYQVKTKEGAIGADGKREILFDGFPVDFSNRITSTVRNPNSPTGRSSDARGIVPQALTLPNVRQDATVATTELEENIQRISQGQLPTPRVQGIVNVTGLPAHSVLTQQAKVNGMDTAPIQQLPVVIQMQQQSLINPQEAQLQVLPRLPEQRRAYGYERFMRTRQFLEMQSKGAVAQTKLANMGKVQLVNGEVVIDRSEGGGDFEVEAVRPILDMIAGPEAGAQGYNAVNRRVSDDTRGGIQSITGKTADQLTVREVISLQKRGIINAFGRYQIIGGTMELAVRGSGVSMDDRMTPEVQDRLGAALLLNGQRPTLSAYIKGQSNDLVGAVNEASDEWAVLKNKAGGSRYNGLAGNRASVPASQTAAMLKLARERYQRAISNSPDPGDGTLATIVDVGKMLHGLGLSVAEHSAFDKQRGYVGKGNARVGGHSDNSYHYSDRAIDITDWRSKNEPKRYWQGRKRALKDAWMPIANKYGLELLGPGDPGHGEHIHLAFPNGTVPRYILGLLRRAYDGVMRKYPLR